VEVQVWNATIANLTLMALGSSAPEILLNVIETVNTRGEPASELGPFTIVGSAAFNLLVITAASIIAVDEVKPIDDMGVFFTTSVFSMFAYFWLLIILTMNSPEVVTINEAWLTFGFFVLLVVLAFSADKWNQAKKKKLKTEAEEAEEQTGQE
jgi:solute carrier family 8 (sodium/calcium exchanger)